MGLMIIYNTIILGFIEVQCINLINTGHILEPICKFLSPKPSGSRIFQPSSLVVEDDDSLDLLSLSNLKCRVLNLCLSHFATSLYCLNLINYRAVFINFAEPELCDFLHLGEWWSCKRIPPHQRGTNKKYSCTQVLGVLHKNSTKMSIIW